MTPEEKEAKRLAANEASRISRERRKLGLTKPKDPEAPKRATSLRDYADALKPRDLSVYTHQVVLEDGSCFSIHKSEDAATLRASQLKNASVAPFTPNPTNYWTTGEQRYDH